MKFYIKKEDGNTNRKKETMIEIPAPFIIAVAAAATSVVTVLLNLQNIKTIVPKKEEPLDQVSSSFFIQNLFHYIQ